MTCRKCGTPVLELTEASTITDRPLLVRSLIVTGLTIVGFPLHSALGVDAATVALLRS
jgi:Na+/H+ antiporter NhaD/arsenite permease-like protein